MLYQYGTEQRRLGVARGPSHHRVLLCTDNATNRVQYCFYPTRVLRPDTQVYRFTSLLFTFALSDILQSTRGATALALPGTE